MEETYEAHLAVAGVLLISVFGVVACGGDDDESQASAEQNLCTSLEGFSAALANVEGVQLGNPDANKANISVQRVRATWSASRLRHRTSRRPTRTR